MSNDWIYIGANVNNHQWSKVGKTTNGLHTRHTSSQSPEYFIFAAYNIINGNVHDIERQLLNHLENFFSSGRILHFSTGNKSECFAIHPSDTQCAVESFLLEKFPSSIPFEALNDDISRYRCPDWVFHSFQRCDVNHQQLFDDWCDDSITPNPSTLSMSGEQYFSGNQAEHEVSLGGGYILDHFTCQQIYRDEDGNETVYDPK